MIEHQKQRRNPGQWHRWFAWYPITIWLEGEAFYLWWEEVDRIQVNRYGDYPAWKYRLPLSDSIA